MSDFTLDLDKNLQVLTIEEWKQLLSSNLSSKFVTKSYHVKPQSLFRARPNFDSKKQEIDLFKQATDLWAPPVNCVIRNGRCNVLGQSTLYCSTSEKITLFEVNPNVGDTLTIMEYDVLKDIDNLGVLGCKEIALIGPDYQNIFGNHLDGRQQESEILDDLLSSFFKSNHTINYPIYNLTNAVFQIFTNDQTDVPDIVKPPKLIGMIYPSIATKILIGINIAMDPDAVKNLLKPVRALKYKILAKDGNNSYVWVKTHTTKSISTNGELEWTKNMNPVSEIISNLR